jgi:hypothetical protein
VRDAETICHWVEALLDPLMPPPMGIRLLGVTLSTLEADDRAPPAQRELDFG